MVYDWRQEHAVASVCMDLKDAYLNYLKTTSSAQQWLQETVTPYQS